MVTALLKRRIGSGSTDAKIAEGILLVAACVVPALIVFGLLKMELTTWQWLVSMIATASLGFQLLVLSFLCRLLRQKKDVQ